MEELHQIAEDADNVLTIEQFDQLNELLEDVTQIACDRLCVA